MKNSLKSFSLIELIFAIVLISIITSIFIPKNNFSKLNLAADKIILYLKYTRYVAMLDNKYNSDDSHWYQELWTLKFQDCTNKDKDGIYYMIYSDTNHGGQPNKDECLKDPITNKYIYSHYCQKDTVGDKSKYVLLKQFGVTNIEVSCYKRTSKEKAIGKISFAHDGKVYSKLTEDNEIEIKKTCFISMYDIEENKIIIAIEPNTGFIHKL